MNKKLKKKSSYIFPMFTIQIMQELIHIFYFLNNFILFTRYLLKKIIWLIQKILKYLFWINR